MSDSITKPHPYRRDSSRLPSTMSDPINIFIQQNRSAMDAHAPELPSWDRLEKVLDRLPQADALERFVWSNLPIFDAEQPSAQVWDSIDQHLQQCRNNNPLEQFICENRGDFDSETPDLSVWSGIVGALEQEAAPQKAKRVSLPWQRFLLRAAASVALLVVGLGAGMWYARSHTDSDMAMAEVSPEYAELQHYYERDISNKKEKLATFTGSQSADVWQDLEQLDQIMAELRQELADVPPGNRQQVVRAMIENYKAKAAILQRVLEHLEENQPGGNNSNLKNEIKNM